MIKDDSYKDAVDNCKPKMLEFMLRLANKVGVNIDEVCELLSDDYMYLVSLSVRYGDELLDVDFAICDAADSTDGGEFGDKGNLTFMINSRDGERIYTICPYNYTNIVWIDYADEDEWNNRIKIIVDCMAEIETLINQWRSRDESPKYRTSD